MTTTSGAPNPADARERALAVIRDALNDGARPGLGHIIYAEAWEAADALAAAEQGAEQLEEVQRLAKRARGFAAAPDYDEESIASALWAVVDAALAHADAPTGETG